jgi:hypothetical protein
VQRLHDEDLFLLVRGSIDPSDSTSIPYRRNTTSGLSRSIRDRLDGVSIEAESGEFLKIGGLLYTFVSVKEPPDSTYPGCFGNSSLVSRWS